MDKNTADVTIILDRSGSMASIKEATIAGLNKFILEVNSEPGEGVWTLVQFDDYSSAKGAQEPFPIITYEAVPSYQVPFLTPETFMPRGGTALVDATCITLERIKKRLLNYPEEVRPKCLVVIMTDGEENSSREYGTSRLRELVSELQTLHKFQFLFLGANIDAFGEAKKYGTHQDVAYVGLAAGASNVLPFVATSAGVAECYFSGGVFGRSWKADGNQSAANLISPDPNAKDHNE